jgi:putative membrane protein
MTPHREIALIRAGNLSASLCFSSALLGVVLPLASAVAHSVSLTDLAVWGGVALLVQLVVHLGTRLLVPDLRGRIERDEVATAVLCTAIHLGAGVLNAAAMVY